MGKRTRTAALLAACCSSTLDAAHVSVRPSCRGVAAGSPASGANRGFIGREVARSRCEVHPPRNRRTLGGRLETARTSASATGCAQRRREVKMLFDFFNPRARSQLESRSYASSKSLFRDIETLNKCSSWTDPVIFSDQMALSPTTRGAIVSSATRSLLVLAGFFYFPTIVEDISPLIFLNDGALTDEVRLGLTGSFLPGVSLLFGALFSYTISLLVNRQHKIEEVVNAEVSALSSLVLHLEDYFRFSPEDLEASMEAAWRHTDTLIFQSRYQEILLLVQDDPLEDLMRLIIAVDDDVLASDAHSHKAGVHRDLYLPPSYSLSASLGPFSRWFRQTPGGAKAPRGTKIRSLTSLGYLRGVASELIRLRTTRLSSEGRVLPPVHFGILVILASMLLFGFTLASAQPPTHEGPVAVAFESQVLFTLLLFSFSLLLEFALDLTNPFVGRYKVRRTTTTAVMVKIRNEIVGVMGTKHMKEFDQAFGKQKRRSLRDFKRETGITLPSDNPM